MTDETKTALKEAQTNRDGAQDRANAAEVRLLEAIAGTLPANVDEIGRRVIEQDINYARKLGADRVKEVRAELRAAADESAALLVRAVGALNWKNDMSSFGPSAYHVKSAVESFFSRRQIEALIAPLKEAEFNPIPLSTVGPSDFAPDSQHVDERAALLEAREDLFEAEGALADATADNDKADAASFWS